MTATKREIIYIDVEDEITSVIDKVVSAKSKIIALVPPKRATMLQSVVNMKLLKRSSDQADKKIVLVTSENALLPLAGLSGIHVAKNLQSKPYIPDSPDQAAAKSTTEDADVTEDEEGASIGDLAAAAGSETVAEAKHSGLDAEDVPEIEPEPVDVPAKGKEKKAKKDKKQGPKIPNFNNFRTKILLGGGALIILIVGWYVLFRVLPKSVVTIKADTSQVNVAETITASTSAKQDDISTRTLVSQLKQTQKAVTQTFTPTGQKNVGEKSKGTASFINCNKDDKLSDNTVTIPAGTAIKNGDKTFVTDAEVSVAPSSYSGNNCQSNKPSADVGVTAQSSGDQYNLSSRSYSVGGFPSVTASGSQMSGGTNKNLQVVSEQDVEAAKQKLNTQNVEEAKKELQKQLGKDYIIIEDSFTTSLGQLAVSPAVNEEGSSATASTTGTYTLLGIKKASLEKLIEVKALKDVNKQSQKVYDNGLKTATFKSDKKVDETNFQILLTAQAYIGPSIDDQLLSKQISGKRTGEASELIRKTPGVRDVHVSLKPFYLRKLPSPSHITVNFDVESGKAED